MNIRRATEADLEGIVKVHYSIFPGSQDPAPEYEYAIKHQTVLVADDKGEVVGFGLLRGTIDSLYLLKKNRSSGVGSRILEQLESIAREQGIRALQVHAHSPDPADFERLVRFYEHRGYRRLPAGTTAAGADLVKELSGT